MESIIVLAGLLLLFLFIGAVLGFVAFYKMRRVERQVNDICTKIAAFLPDEKLASKQPVSQPSIRNTDIAFEVPTQEPIGDEVSDSEPEIAQTPEEIDRVVGQTDSEEADQSIHAKKLSDEADGGPDSTAGADEAAEITPVKPARNLEETIGSLWAVWVGGLALALGAVFLVKFSIDRGLLSPAIRILLGLAFSGFLIGLGEWGAEGEGRHFPFQDFPRPIFRQFSQQQVHWGLFLPFMQPMNYTRCFRP